jgi:hypothetical protein
MVYLLLMNQSWRINVRINLTLPWHGTRQKMLVTGTLVTIITCHGAFVAQLTCHGAPLVSLVAEPGNVPLFRQARVQL